jgi:hypothetical protein
MMRLRAVRTLLVRDVAHLRPVEGPDAEASAAIEREALARARRRALTMAVVAAAALVALFVFRQPGREFLPFERGEESLFTLGVVFIAAFLGFRLAGYLQLQTFERVYDELAARDEE